MYRDEVATCTGLVGQVRIICELCISDEGMKTRAIEHLDDVLSILTRPSEMSEDGLRAKWREQKRQQRQRKEQLSADSPRKSARKSADIPRNTVVVVGEAGEAEEVEVEAGEEVVVGRQSWSSSVADVYTHYRNHHPRAAPKLTSQTLEYRRIVEALKNGFSVSDCCDAIDGYHRSPFHIGVNSSGAKHLGLSLIFRDVDHVTKGIEMALDPLIGEGFNEQSRATIHAIGQWVEETSS